MHSQSSDAVRPATPEAGSGSKVQVPPLSDAGAAEAIEPGVDAAFDRLGAITRLSLAAAKLGSRHGPAGTADLNAVEPPLTVIKSDVHWRWLNWKELWDNRELLFFLAWRDIKVRYKQTLLGAAWAILQPAMMMVIFTIFFSRMAGVSSGDMPYPVFVYAGLLPWTFFATAIASAGNSVIGSERLITKIYFPRLAIPIAAVGAAVMDLLIAFGLLLGLMFYYGVTPGLGVLLVPAIFAVILLFAVGVGTCLAALNVRYRDFRYVIPFMLQIWMFATPTVYMQAAGSQSPWLSAILAANPMTGLVGAFRDAMLGHPIAWAPLATALGITSLAFVCGCLYFRACEDGFSDLI